MMGVGKERRVMVRNGMRRHDVLMNLRIIGGIIAAIIIEVALVFGAAAYHDHQYDIVVWQMDRLPSYSLYQLPSYAKLNGTLLINDRNAVSSDDMSIIRSEVVRYGSFWHHDTRSLIVISSPHHHTSDRDWCIDSGVDFQCHKPSSMTTDDHGHLVLSFNDLPVKSGHTMLSGLFYKDNLDTAVLVNDDWPAW
jgi:hypothetical protein